jgi:MinD-like ATPase involved in chromosome partitioning or flagellar assembly
MVDQANKLRQLIHGAEPCARISHDGPAMVVIAGGRAGVGATTVAVNLAAVLQERVGRVLVVDVVEERSNLLAAVGVRRTPEFGLDDVLAGKCEIGDAMVEGPGQIMLLARCRVRRGGRKSESRRDSSTVGRVEQQRLMSGLDSLRDEFDFVLVDAGTGVSAWSRRFWLRAALVVLVTTTDGPAVLDSYAMLKRSIVDANGPEVRLLVNQCDVERTAAEAQQRFADACQRFLGRSVPALPALPQWSQGDGTSSSTWPRVWEGANTSFGHAALWLGRAVADAVRIEDAGCRIEGTSIANFPASRIPHPASC